MRRLFTTTSVVAFAAVVAACGGQQGAGSASGASQVWVAGSSTVYPFATRVSENWARSTGSTAAKVEALGTGGGISQFCGGVGDSFPDIATASRPMKASEFDTCQTNGVEQIVELKIGYDGIVLLNALDGAKFDLTEEQIYRALAAELPQGGAFVANPNRTWADVDPGLPAQNILVYGPPTTSGTRDAFVELAMRKGAEGLPELKALKDSDGDAFEQRADTIRTGAWQDSGENDNAIIGTLTKTPGSLGVVGYSFLENNRDQVQAATVHGIAPTTEAIADGAYPLSRSLYIYVKVAHLDLKPELRSFVEEFVSDGAAGPDGYLRERGLIPLPVAEHDAIKQSVSAMTPMGRPTK